MSYLLLSQDIKQKVLSSFYLDNYVINFTIYLRSPSKAIADREKEGRTEIQKFE